MCHLGNWPTLMPSAPTSAVPSSRFEVDHRQLLAAGCNSNPYRWASFGRVRRRSARMGTESATSSAPWRQAAISRQGCRRGRPALAASHGCRAPRPGWAGFRPRRGWRRRLHQSGPAPHALRMGLPSERLLCCRAPRRAAAAGGQSPGLNRTGTALLLAFPDSRGRFERAPQAGDAGKCSRRPRVPLATRCPA